MEEHYEGDKDFCDSLFACEIDFIDELLESGSTWVNAKNLLAKQTNGSLKKYLKSSEVMELLQVSPGTLQTLRINGTLPYTKVGGILYYDSEEIHKVMTANRVHNSLNS